MHVNFSIEKHNTESQSQLYVKKHKPHADIHLRAGLEFEQSGKVAIPSSCVATSNICDNYIVGTAPGEVPNKLIELYAQLGLLILGYIKGHAESTIIISNIIVDMHEIVYYYY